MPRRGFPPLHLSRTGSDKADVRLSPTQPVRRYALVGCRGDKEAGAQERVLSAFLTEMDGVGVRLEGLKMEDEEKFLLEGSCDGLSSPSQEVPPQQKEKINTVGVVVIAATNRPDMIDSALLRPGRFDKLLYVPAPHAAERREILKCVTRNIPLDDSVDFTHLVENTHLYSGADLSNLCKEAALSALSLDGMSVTNVNQHHFEVALQRTRASLTEDQIKWYEDFMKSS